MSDVDKKKGGRMKAFHWIVPFSMALLLAGGYRAANAAVICTGSPCVEDATGNDLTGIFKAFSLNAANNILQVLFTSDVTELVPPADAADNLAVTFLGGCLGGPAGGGACSVSGETGQVVQTGFNFVIGAMANSIVQFTGPNDTVISDQVGLWVDSTGNKFAVTFSSDPAPFPTPIPEPAPAVLFVSGLAACICFTRGRQRKSA